MNTANLKYSILNEVKSLALMAIESKSQALSIIAPFSKVQKIVQRQMIHAVNLGKHPFLASCEQLNRSVFMQLYLFINCHANIQKLLQLNSTVDKKNLVKNGAEKDDIPILKSILRRLRKELRFQKLKSFKKLKEVRNDIEHYSTRLLGLMAQTGNMSSFKICNQEGYHNLAHQTTQENYMRVYILDKDVFCFQGKEYSLSKASQDLESLISKITEISKYPI